MPAQSGLFESTDVSVDRLTSADPAAWPVRSGWQTVLAPFWSSPEGLRLQAFLCDRLAAGATVYPPHPLRALELLSPEEVRVVILGQDPYHGPGQAEGLAFSVAPGVRLPPSLRNIFKELQRDLGVPFPADGSLVRWARQGVLLINASLTVEDGQAASHAGRGWEVLTDHLLVHVATLGRPLAFLLWGSHAQRKASLLGGGHVIFRANHPSPLSALRPPEPFIGCGHFGAVNAWLTARGEVPIAW